MAIGAGKTNEMQANSTILSLISRSIVLALLPTAKFRVGRGDKGSFIHPFLAGARGRVYGGRFAVIAVENWRNLVAYFALVRKHNRRK